MHFASSACFKVRKKKLSRIKLFVTVPSFLNWWLCCPPKNVVFMQALKRHLEEELIPPDLQYEQTNINVLSAKPYSTSMPLIDFMSAFIIWCLTYFGKYIIVHVIASVKSDVFLLHRLCLPLSRYIIIKSSLRLPFSRVFRCTLSWFLWREDFRIALDERHYTKCRHNACTLKRKNRAYKLFLIKDRLSNVIRMRAVKRN
jgi:hypothetical protein